MGTFLLNFQEDIIIDAQQASVRLVCGWWDSNPHGLAPRALRTHCVCHCATPAQISGLPAPMAPTTQPRNARCRWPEPR